MTEVTRDRYLSPWVHPLGDWYQSLVTLLVTKKVVMLQVKLIKNYPIDSNCYVIYDKAIGDDCIIVDPGSEDNSLLFEFLKSESLNPQYIILTHEHFDHCWGVNQLRRDFPTVKLVCTSSCSAAIQNRKKNYSVFYQEPGFDVEAADIELESLGWLLDWYGYKLAFYPVQGHTVSGVMFTIANYIFTGDELIKGIKTVTKLKTGSKEKLAESMELLESMKGRNLTVCAGHGEMFPL